MKTLPLRFILQPKWRVMEFDDKVMALGSLSIFLAVIIEKRACSNWWEMLFYFFSLLFLVGFLLGEILVYCIFCFELYWVFRVKLVIKNLIIFNKVLVESMGISLFNFYAIHLISSNFFLFLLFANLYIFVYIKV